jgi:predicted house-cleaning noncanonical NTP pyrophosphatase (MazG superfamily)
MKFIYFLISFLLFSHSVSGQEKFSKRVPFTPIQNHIKLDFPSKSVKGSLDQLKEANKVGKTISLDSAKTEEYQEKILHKLEQELSERSGLGEMETRLDPLFAEELPNGIPAVDGSLKERLNPNTLQEDFLSERGPLEKAMNDLEKKKIKYSKIEDSRYPEYAKKRNSLTDRKFRQRGGYWPITGSNTSII